MQDFLMCRVCLATNVKMYNIHTYNLDHYYSLIIGNGTCESNLPEYVCHFCSYYLKKFYNFHEKCHKAQDILNEASLHYDKTSVDFNENINDKAKLLAHNLSIQLSSVDIYLSYSELPMKYEITEEIFETKPDFVFQFDPENVKLDSPGDYSFDHNVSSPDSKSDNEPLSKTINRKPKECVKLKNEKSGKKKFHEDFAEVILLSKEQQLQDVENRKYGLNYLNSPYKCDKCYKGFLEDMSYKNHMSRHDENNGDFLCDICQIRCQTERKLRSHCVSAHERKYACRECSHVSNTCNQAREHEKWHRGFTYSCEICGQVFRKSTTRLTHVRLRHPTEHVCDLCGESFIGSHGLTMHKKRAHKECQEETMLLDSFCSECDFQFVSKEAYDRHTFISAKHSGDNGFCNYCRMCGEAFESEKSLQLHYKMSHGNGGVGAIVKCDECVAQFPSAKKCAAHYRRVHLGLKYSTNKDIVCEICGKKCTSNATLQYHQRTHTGEKPYQCTICPKSFSVRQRLQIHARTHTGERPYPCPHCPKAFRHKPALNRHARVHTGAKPYTCSYCKKSFSQSNSMKLHIHTVHFKLPPPYKSRKGKTNE